MYDIKELLNYIQPSELTYQEWINVGMALKTEGCTAADWDSWSRHDTRYKAGECFRKWGTFQRSGTDTVTGGTIYELAVRGGFVPPSKDPGHALDWDDSIVKDDLQVVDGTWLEEREVEEPADNAWNPVQDLITYLQTLFQSTENVGYVTDVYETEDRLAPKKGNWDRTAGELIEELRRYKDIGAVVGDPNPAAGAWIRFNPLDGNGVKNDNVTDYRFALVESDAMSLGRQEAIIRELELPVAALVFSGKKSIHAIVRVEAPDYSEYRKRVEYLYKVCEKNGLKVDTQNKNPSRLSRMPGVVRNGHKQFLMATNIGKRSWEEWHEWIEGVNDDLPDPEDLADVWDNLPPLADCLIDGVLRKGHKMLLAGPSKAGKSFLLIELVIAIAEGTSWLNFPCRQGRVLYVNMELDRASCLRRFKDVYQALGITPKGLGNIDIWNLRGKTVPMDKLTPKLIRRAEKKNYVAVIIDPIYKVITGDENSAEEMAKFCNQFDKICTSLSVSMIYCHHHSKGAQGGKKAMDRASGSGVFARDPDAMLDFAPLEITDDLKKAEEGKARIMGIAKALDEYFPGWRHDVGQDDMLSPSAMQEYAGSKLNFDQANTMAGYVAEALAKTRRKTAWRLEGIFREFPEIPPLNMWFDFPIHHLDESDVLKDIVVEGDKAQAKKKWAEKQKEAGKQTAQAYLEALEDLFKDDTTEIDYKELAEYLGKSPDTVKKDFCGAKRKGGSFDPRHSKAMQEAGYVWKRGRICKKDTMEDTTKSIVSPSP